MRLAFKDHQHRTNQNHVYFVTIQPNKQSRKTRHNIPYMNKKKHEQSTSSIKYISCTQMLCHEIKPNVLHVASERHWPSYWILLLQPMKIYRIPKKMIKTTNLLYFKISTYKDYLEEIPNWWEKPLHMKQTSRYSASEPLVAWTQDSTKTKEML